MITTRTLLSTTTLMLGALLLGIPVGAAAQTFSIDTGPGGTSSLGSPAVFASGSTSCSPQPACAANFQFLAGQFTLANAAAIDSIQIWAVGNAGSMDVKIRPSTATGVPSLTTTLYTKRYSVTGQFPANWAQFSNYGAVLPAGTYWIALEPVNASGLNWTLPIGAANPLPSYAYYGNGNLGYNRLPSSNTLGFRISGTNVPSEASGTATRTILGGSVFGFPFPTWDVIAGDTGAADTTSWFFEIPAGWSYARGQINNGLNAGAYSATSGGGFCTQSCTSASGAGRGVAYMSFKNTTSQNMTFRVNAVAEGAFQAGGGQAAAGVYLFDPAQFSTAITSSGKTAGEFLLSRDDLARLSNPNGGLTLATLFPAGALLESAFQVLTGPTGQIFSTPLTTGLITITPNQSVTVMFDISAYARPGGDSNFASTLKPATNLFTDPDGNAVTALISLGPAAVPPATAASIVLAPASATNTTGTSQTMTATVKTSANLPVANALVFFAIGSGPNANAGGPIVTDASGVATFTYADGLGPGIDAVQAQIGALQSNVAQITWQGAGAFDHIAISPASATIAADGTQAYTAEGFDIFGTSLGDVTASTVFSIAPDGSCAAATCTAAIAGAHTVTGNDGGKIATATLNVTGGGGATAYTFAGFFQPIDMSTTSTIVWNTLKAGQAVPVKWQLLLNGAPVSDPASFVGLSSASVACGAASSSVDDAIEELATGNSALQYSGDGSWQYNWATAAAYRSTCRTIVVKFKDGTTSPVAYFKFK